MLRFFRTKKGFTLVELMVVVAILSVLIAVAVPVYSAITTRARKKTCISNQKDIVLQLNNYCAVNKVTLCGEPALVYDYTEDSDSWIPAIVDFTDENGNDVDFDEDTFKSMFDIIPCCPAKGTYEIYIYPSGVTGSKGNVKVVVECLANEDNNEHK